MKRIISLILPAIILVMSACVREQVVIAPSGSKTPPAGSIYSDDNLRILYGNNVPAFGRDGLPNSELQVKAYKTACRDVCQAGHWLGGACLSWPYAINTYFWGATPPAYDLKDVPQDSLYWYSRYYEAEVKRIRTANAWYGFAIIEGIGLIVCGIVLLSLSASLSGVAP